MNELMQEYNGLLKRHYAAVKAEGDGFTQEDFEKYLPEYMKVIARLNEILIELLNAHDYNASAQEISKGFK